MATKKTSDGTVIYKDDVATRNAVYEKVLAFFMEQECFSGECCYQCDNVQLESPDLLAELADDIFEFDVQEEEDDDEIDYNPVSPNKISTVKTRYIDKGKGSPMKFDIDDDICHGCGNGSSHCECYITVCKFCNKSWSKGPNDSICPYCKK